MQHRHTHITFTLAVAVVLGACWSPPARVDPTPLEVIRVDPLVGVAPDGVVAVELTAPLLEPVEAGVVRALLVGDERPIELSVEVDGSTLALQPQPSWPASSTIRVVLDGLRAFDGRAWPVVSFTFETQAMDDVPTYVVEAPAPGTLAPVNLATLVVMSRGSTPLERVTLVSDRDRVAWPISAREGSGRVVARRPAGATQLAPSTRYHVELPEGWAALVGATATVQTGTQSDTSAPQLRLRSVWRGGEGVRAAVEADEPVLARGEVVGPDGVAVDLVAPLAAGRRLELDARDRLVAGARYVLRLFAADLAGNEAPPLEVELVMPEEVRVQLTEVVPTPLHDWGSDDEGVPFDGRPGTGAVTDADEWIELLNVSEAPVDLTQVDVRVRVLDGTPVEHALVAAAQLYFGRGGDATRWGVGEPLVLRPRGTMAQRDVAIEIVWGDEVLDRVYLGRTRGADHSGGAPPDLDHEAIARDGEVWRWCRPSPGEPWPVGCLR